MKSYQKPSIIVINLIQKEGLASTPGDAPITSFDWMSGILQ